MRQWRFRPEENESSSKFYVSIVQDCPQLPNGDVAEIIFLDDMLNDKGEYCFRLLTGLSPALLKDTWKDKIPPTKPLERIAIKASGLPEVVERLQWPKPISKKH